MAERRHPRIRSVCATSLLVGACAPPEIPPDDVAAIQLAAATVVAASIAANPGSIVAVCVGYEGRGGATQLPSVRPPAPVVSGMDGCREQDGRLTVLGGDGQAISVTVRTPQPVGALRADVAVLTSTGGGDLAAYTCTVSHEGGAWRSNGCDLDAIS